MVLDGGPASFSVQRANRERHFHNLPSGVVVAFADNGDLKAAVEAPRIHPKNNVAAPYQLEEYAHIAGSMRSCRALEGTKNARTRKRASTVLSPTLPRSSGLCREGQEVLGGKVGAVSFKRAV